MCSRAARTRGLSGLLAVDGPQPYRSRTRQPDLILRDLGLHGIDGFEQRAVEGRRGDPAPSPIIVLSAHAMTNDFATWRGRRRRRFDTKRSVSSNCWAKSRRSSGNGPSNELHGSVDR